MPIFKDILGKRNLQSPILYGISNRRAFPNLEPLSYMELLFQTRADIVQWREKDLPAEQNRIFIQRGVRLASETGKRYACSNCGSEFVVTRSGEGTISCCGRPTTKKT